MKDNQMNETPSLVKWEYQTCIPFKTVIKENKDRLPLRHMDKRKIYDKNTSIFRFQVGYMRYPILEKHRTHREQDINMFSSAFQEKNNEGYQIYIAEKYVLFISLIIFYHNRKTVLYKMIGYVVYLFIDNLIFLDYLGMIQHKLSDYDNKLKK